MFCQYGGGTLHQGTQELITISDSNAYSCIHIDRQAVKAFYDARSLEVLSNTKLNVASPPALPTSSCNTPAKSPVQNEISVSEMPLGIISVEGWLVGAHWKRISLVLVLGVGRTRICLHQDPC